MTALRHGIHDSLIHSATPYRASSTQQLFVLEAAGPRRHRPGHGARELGAVGRGPCKTKGSVCLEEKAEGGGTSKGEGEHYRVLQGLGAPEAASASQTEGGEKRALLGNEDIFLGLILIDSHVVALFSPVHK